MTEAIEGFTRGWNALRTDDGWVLIVPVPVGEQARAADNDEHVLSDHLPGDLPRRLVVLTAANPGGVVLSASENDTRNERLLERISGLEPFPCNAPRTYLSVGGSPQGDGPADWDHREEGVALDISRDEAAMIAAEFGQIAYYAFDGPDRLLIGAGHEGVLAVQRYRVQRA